MTSREPLSVPARQRGAVLIVGLIILFVMTLLGITAMQTTTLEEAMAGNLQDRDLAFQAAEAALREGEFLIGTSAPILNENCSNGLCVAQAFQLESIRGWQRDPSHAVWNNAREYNGSLPLVANQPVYIIEDMCEFTKDGETTPVNRQFRITAVGTGQSPTTRVILQSTYLAQFNAYGGLASAEGTCDSPADYCAGDLMDCSYTGNPGGGPGGGT